MFENQSPEQRGPSIEILNANSDRDASPSATRGSVGEKRMLDDGLSAEERGKVENRKEEEKHAGKRDIWGEGKAIDGRRKEESTHYW